MNDYVRFRLDWTEEDYGHMDEKIRELLKALHQFRIKTIMSCEGHIRKSWIYAGVYPYPWVILILNPSDLRRMEAKLKEWNRQNKGENWILSGKRVHGSFTPAYIRSDVTCDDDTLTVTALVPENDNEKDLSATALAAFQQQVPRLASFISA